MSTVIVIHYTFKFWLVLEFWNFWAGSRLWSMVTTKIVAEGWSEGLKQLIIVLSEWSAIETGVPAPLMFAVLPEIILPLLIFEQNSVCVFNIPTCGIPPILYVICETVGKNLSVIIYKVFEQPHIQRIPFLDIDTAFLCCCIIAPSQPYFGLLVQQNKLYTHQISYNRH